MKTKVLLVGIDGLVLSRALESGKAKTLAGLKDESFFTEWKVNVPTLSGPSWSTLLTGATYEEHRVQDNSFVGHNLLNRPDLLSRAFYQDQSTTTFAAAGWPPLVDPAGHGPVIHQRKEQQLAYKHFVVVRDGETYGYQRIDSEITDASVYSLENFGADVNFVYFCGIDEAGHAYGILGDEYLTAIERVDAHLTRLHDAITKRAESYGEQWLLVMVTDHGHRDEGGHGGDSEQERASFVIAHGIGRENPQWKSHIEPHHLTDLLLAQRA